MFCLLKCVVVVFNFINIVDCLKGDFLFFFVFFNIKCVVVVFFILGGLYIIMCCGLGL